MRSRWLAGGLAVACAGLAVAAVALVLLRGWSFAQALEGFVTSNVVIGTSFGTFLYERWQHQPMRMGLTLFAIAVVGSLLST